MSNLYRYFYLLTAFLAAAACSKISDNIIWQISRGNGEALFASPAGDTALLCGGILSGKPYLVLIDSKHDIISEYSDEKEGKFTSGLVSEHYIIATGESGGKVLVTSVGKDGFPVWDTTLEFGFNVERVSLCRKSDGNFLAIASKSADSLDTETYGIAFISFNGDGEIISFYDTLFYSFYAVSGVTVGSTGNIYLAVTEAAAGGKTKAVVVSYNENFKYLWEKELYNNPEYGASCLAITVDNEENIYTSGYAELPDSKGNIRNAFAASLTWSGTIRWKKYLEYNNISTSLILTHDGRLFVLNNGCLILNTLNTVDGTITGIIRTFAVCDPSFDRAEGKFVTEVFDNVIVIAGTKNGSFYIVAKSPDSLSPV